MIRLSTFQALQVKSWYPPVLWADPACVHITARLIFQGDDKLLGLFGREDMGSTRLWTTHRHAHLSKVQHSPDTAHVS